MQLDYGEFTFNHQHFYLAGTSKGLAFVGSPDADLAEISRFFPQATLEPNQDTVQVAADALVAYLSGQAMTVDVPLDVINGTPLQRQVWTILQEIPYGHTWNYTQLAQAVGRPTAVRAVATAVGKNPLMLVIPCHRILRKDGALGGFRGGLPLKRQLLTLEA
ncbi:methylated-DNA--[protein]-cysteine S-methyltransferase [Lacticaseibacillus brantae]|uniref:methylated-DNA--[protein]-cysteine S-methyltransferase n=1 Tax=Lacticaseibacillus brantae DSM 23927 TaxID=1423727 RepID=A0A0R2AXF5_9LACO|nr:methylated-DNA--[protein]-cysteine S-methyltransferase [Lacticaseibacillus brantae]KRM71687.1 methylated-DNA--protein-cysteine methyltransferase, inducible [Lacticaseibacillus brantae DSM 23927]